jgi:hypothetical protein
LPAAAGAAHRLVLFFVVDVFIARRVGQASRK